MNLNKSIDLILYNLGYISALIANECSYYFNNILIIEQNKEFGIPRKCGNYFYKNYLNLLGLSKLNQNILESFIEAYADEIIYYDENKNELGNEKSDIIIFDSRLLERAIIKNINSKQIKIRVNSHIKSFKLDPNKNINKIIIKSFKSYFQIQPKYIISKTLLTKHNKEHVDNQKNEKIKTVLYQLYVKNFNLENKIHIYSINNGKIILYPSLNDLFYIWIIGVSNKLNFSKFLNQFLNIKKYSILSINYQDFYPNYYVKDINFSNFLLISPEFGLINPIKCHYFMSELELVFFINKYIKKEENFYKIFKDFYKIFNSKFKLKFFIH